MNKLVTVLGVAAVATLAGCKDPNYKPMASSQDEVKAVEPAPVVEPLPAAPTCKCAPGTKHASPCACGAADCQCVVEVKPVALPPPVTEPASTTYIVQNGDSLSKISKKYNIKVDAIKKLNGLKNDTIRVGQKLKLPGTVDVGVQKEPVKAVVAKKTAAAKPVDYKGATKDYVVKSGDTLGAIAYGNGLNIRQLKKLNALSSDSLKVGQKLKVPADGKAAAAVVKPEVKKVESAPVKQPEPPKVEPVVEAPAVSETPAEPVVAAPVAPAEAAPAAPIAAPTPAAVAEPATSTYVVQESDDMTGVTIRFGVTAAAIRELNNLPEDAQLTPGQVIKLPADAQQ